MVVSFLGLLGYLLVPAIGPMYTLRNQYTVPLHQSIWMFNREVDFMDFARIRRDVFPSLHVAHFVCGLALCLPEFQEALLDSFAVDSQPLVVHPLSSLPLPD